MRCFKCQKYNKCVAERCKNTLSWVVCALCTPTCASSCKEPLLELKIVNLKTKTSEVDHCTHQEEMII